MVFFSWSSLEMISRWFVGCVADAALFGLIHMLVWYRFRESLVKATLVTGFSIFLALSVWSMIQYSVASPGLQRVSGMSSLWMVPIETLGDG